MRSFWPAGEPAQIDYESLRAAVVGASGLPADLAAAPFYVEDWQGWSPGRSPSRPSRRAL